MYTISITNYYSNYCKVYSLGKEEEPKWIWASVTLCTTNQLPSGQCLTQVTAGTEWLWVWVCLWLCVPPDDLVPYSGYCWDRVALSLSLSVTLYTTIVPTDCLVPYLGYCWHKVVLSLWLCLSITHCVLPIVICTNHLTQFTAGTECFLFLILVSLKEYNTVISV